MASFNLVRLLCIFILFSSCSARPETSLKSASCSACTFLVDILHNLWGDRIIEDCLGDLIAYTCETLKINDNTVCKGFGSAFEQEIDYITKSLVVEPSEICGLLIPECGHFIDPLNATWHLEMPPGKPPHRELPPIQSGQPTLKVLHLTDIHIDREYTPGLEADCGEPMCCRPLGDPDEVSDGRKLADGVKVPAGYWGTVAACDAPYWLFTAMLDRIAATHKDLDYVVVSGDLESHAEWEYTRERHQELIRNISDSIRQRLPNVNIFFAVGNHEGVPIDNFAPHFVPEKFQMDWLYRTMAEAWKGWVPEDQDAEVRFNACYMRKLYPGLRLISLNNGLGDYYNFFLYINQTDPDGTLTWFMNQLWDAEKAGDKVHVVAHIPGGTSEALEGWALNYYNIVNRFEDTIVAQFFGHTHSEQFNVFFEDPNDQNSRPTAVSYSAPSLTPNGQYNPAYRVYEIEGNHQGSNYRVIDWTEYYVDLKEANVHPDKALQWKTLYESVLEEYGLKDVSAPEWVRLINDMSKNETLFELYRKNYYRRVLASKCNTKCRSGFLCKARQSHHNETLCSDLPGRAAAIMESKHISSQSAIQLDRETILDSLKRFKIKRGVRDDDACPFG